MLRLCGGSLNTAAGFWVWDKKRKNDLKQELADKGLAACAA